MPVGGAFGGKQAYIPLGICLVLTQKSRLPVKLLLTREEEFMATNPRHPVMANIKTGVRKDGTIVSREVRLTYDTGAFAQEGPGATYGGALGSCGAYNYPILALIHIAYTPTSIHLAPCAGTVVRRPTLPENLKSI
jgi:CO/xanthine dehydrogenase Mo-binding subunit